MMNNTYFAPARIFLLLEEYSLKKFEAGARKYPFAEETFTSHELTRDRSVRVSDNLLPTFHSDILKLPLVGIIISYA